MRIDFIENPGGPDRLVCEAEIVFEQEGALAGMKLVGFSLWRSPDGELYVTFPSRSFGGGSDRRFFDFLRSADGLPAAGRAVKAWIMDQYRQGQAQKTQTDATPAHTA